MNGHAVRQVGGRFLCLGNPLMDIQVNATPKFITDRNLELDNAILARPEHASIVEEMKQEYKHLDYIPGGAGQNTCKLLGQLVDDRQRVQLMGTVGQDRYAELLSAKLNKLGVSTYYQVNPSLHTGHVAALINGEFRSLVAFLGAAETFTADHLIENWSLVEESSFFYIAGFFLVTSVQGSMDVARHASAHEDKLFVTNLSAPYICEHHSRLVLDILPFVDILIGNEYEADQLAITLAWDRDVKTTAQRLAKIPGSNSSRARVVIITSGKHPLVVADGDLITEHQIPDIPQEEVVDTNGAGDAFVAGLFYGLMHGASLDAVIKSGIDVAQQSVRRLGCNIPAHLHMNGR